MSIEAMKQALEALEKGCVPIEGWMPDIDEAITSLRQAIAEAEKQEPATKEQIREAIVFNLPLYTHPQPKREQEPVAHCEAGPDFCQQCRLEDRSLALAAAIRYVKNNTPKLVYDEICMALTIQPTSQPKREWVGLDFNEQKNIWDISRASIPRFQCFANLIEKALKDKNT